MTALPVKLSVKVLILDAQGLVLLLRRSTASKNHAGKWEFPGGKTDPGETFDEALLREVREETGLAIELGDVVGAGQSVLADKRIAYLFMQAALMHGGNSEVRTSDEHDQFTWVQRAKLLSFDLCPQFRAIAAVFSVATE
jgi:8-oxo-dGTP diphosphatase